MSKSEKNWYKIWNSKKEIKINKNKLTNELLTLNGFDKHSIIKKKDYKIFIKKLRFILKIDKNKNIFEFGCGSGLILFFLKKYSKNVSGYDISKSLISIAQKVLNQKKNITNLKKILKEFDKFDVVIMNSVLQYLSYRSAKKIIKNLILLSKSKVFIGDILDIKKKKMYLDYREKYYGKKIYLSKYKNLKHTFYNQAFFREIAKKNNLKIRFFKNIIENYKQGEFRFNVLFLK